MGQISSSKFEFESVYHLKIWNMNCLHAGVWKCKKKSEIIWNVWKDVLFNAFKLHYKSENVFFLKQKVWNQIKIWTLTSLYMDKLWLTYRSTNRYFVIFKSVKLNALKLFL